MIGDLSIRSDSGGVSNLAWNDLAVIHGHEGVRWWGRAPRNAMGRNGREMWHDCKEP